MPKFPVQAVEYAGETQYVRSAPAVQMVALLEKQPDLSDMEFNFELVAASLCDANGKNGLDITGEVVGTWPWSFVSELIRAATDINGFGDLVESDESKKN